jgi:ceramide glucosyltransferase
VTLTLALLLLAAAGGLMTTFQTGLVLRFLGRRRFFVLGPRGRATSASRPAASTATPRVSILKPLCGLDDGLEENLASFASLAGVTYEVVLSAARPDDPAVAVARQVIRRFPAAPFHLVVGGGTGIPLANPKVERLVAAAREARGEILFVSDSNVRVQPGDVTRIVAAFGDPLVGCVSTLFTGAAARSFGAVVESLHLLTFVLPGAVIAEFGGVPCVVGKSMALSRRALEAIGGFAAFVDVLAEDQAIGCAVRDAGFEVTLSPVVVRNVTTHRRLGPALARQVRWGKIRFSFSRLTYTGELLLNPFPIALLACAAAALLAARALPAAALLAGSLLLLRLAQGIALARVTRADHAGWQLLLLPVKDVLQFATQAVPYLSKEVDWQGHRARLGPGTLLLPSRHAAAAAAAA